MAKEMYITHFVNQEPSEYGWKALPFITQPIENSEGLAGQQYFLGLEFHAPIPPDVMAQNVADKYFVPLSVPQKVTVNESVWVSPEGHVYVANHKAPMAHSQTLVYENAYTLSNTHEQPGSYGNETGFLAPMANTSPVASDIPLAYNNDKGQEV